MNPFLMPFYIQWVDPVLKTIRNEMIDGIGGYKKIFVKTHLDSMVNKSD